MSDARSMPAVRHHVDEPLLLSYACGALPESYSVVVAAHVSLCDECRARMGAFEAVGGVALAETGTEPMAEGSFAATLARARAARPIVVNRKARRLPAPIDDYVGGDIDDIAWRSVGGGVRQMKLDTAGEGTVRLLYIPAGRAVPDHGHNGLELTMVLSGAYRDSVDRFGRGDVEIADDDVEHQPMAETGEPCICIAATSARLRFRSLIPRLLGPVLGI
jgi:putative transcriptional regulator